jgi:glycosyltransferase involved in cell wall biosynthesis
MSDLIFSENPLITVVIPTYNRSLLVSEAIASVLAQTYTNWELIVADDGSQDDTVKNILAMTDPRIRVLALPHSGNVATVRNAGARAGSGAWIAFLDSDDLWIPQKLEIQLDLLKKEGKRWIYGGYEMMNDAGQAAPFRAGTFTPFSGWIVKELLTTEASVNMGTLMVERTLFNEIRGFDTEPLLNYREDYDLALRLALRADVIASPERLMRIREHKGRGGNSDDGGNARTAYAYLHFIKAHAGGTQPEKELTRIARRQFAYHLTESAVISIRKGSYLQAAGEWGRALMNGDRWRHLLSGLRRGFLRERGNIH